MQILAFALRFFRNGVSINPCHMELLLTTLYNGVVWHWLYGQSAV